MLLFKLLVLAHFVADFPLQSAGVYRMKMRSAAGQLPHALICFAVSALLGAPLAGEASFWALIAAVALSHLVIDIFKVNVLDRRVGGDNLWTFLLDQALHISSAAMAFLTVLPLSPALRGGAVEKLDSAGALDAAILFFAGVFGGAYLLNAFKRTVLDIPADELVRGGFAKFYGVAERGAVFAVVFAGGLWLMLAPIIFAVRIPAANWWEKRFQPKGFLLSAADVAGNLIIAVAAALCARLR